MSLFCALSTVPDSCLQRAGILLEEIDMKQGSKINNILMDYDKGHEGNKQGAVTESNGL